MTEIPDIKLIRHGVSTGARSAVEVLEEFETRADLWEPRLGVYVHRAGVQARADASALDSHITAGGTAGPLAGVPIGVKDIVRTHDAPTTGQSLVSPWTDRPAWGQDAPVVARLRAAGAIITGKTTTLEHALGFSDPDKGFPLPRNPWNPDLWTGGSSSGSASGLAVGAFAGAVGTDTAGSIRMPAAWCGVTGLKPTYDLVPRDGVLPLAWTLDHIGPMARSAHDCSLLLAVMANRTPPEKRPDPEVSLNGLRVGVLRDAMSRSTPAVQDRVNAALEALAAHGAEIVPVRAPHHDAGIASTMLTLAAEAFSLHRPDLAARWHDFSRATRAATLTGLMLSAADLVQISRVRKHLAIEVDRLLDHVDVLVGPTASTTAPDVTDLDFGEVVASMQTVYWNATGHPALSLPAGLADGLPVGLQAVTRRHGDQWLLSFGERFQEITDHHSARPISGLSSALSDQSNDKPGSTPQIAGVDDIARLKGLLAAVGVSPDADEVETAAAGWPSVRETLDEVWAVPIDPQTPTIAVPSH